MRQSLFTNRYKTPSDPCLKEREAARLTHQGCPAKRKANNGGAAARRHPLIADTNEEGTGSLRRDCRTHFTLIGISIDLKEWGFFKVLTE